MEKDLQELKGLAEYMVGKLTDMTKELNNADNGQKQTEPVEEVSTQPKKLETESDIEDAKKEAKKAVSRGVKKTTVFEILARYGVTRVSNLPHNQIQNFITEIKNAK